LERISNTLYWATPELREAVPCLAVSQINDLGKGASNWLSFSFFVATDERARADSQGVGDV
jgi:hypothetical protein